jgi:hypothetical protein
MGAGYLVRQETAANVVPAGTRVQVVRVEGIRTLQWAKFSRTRVIGKILDGEKAGTEVNLQLISGRTPQRDAGVDPNILSPWSPPNPATTAP